MKSILFAIAIGTIGLGAASSAAAVVCANTDISPNALSCAGFYNGNLLSNSAGDITAQQSALASIGFAWNGDWNAAEKITGLAGNQTVNFATLLQGISYVGLHFGNGNGGPGNATAFYKLDGGAGLDTFQLAYRASSNAVLYSTTPAVPEASTWAMLLAGFGIAGAVVRRSRTLGPSALV